jgi:hypothetical protein
MFEVKTYGMSLHFVLQYTCTFQYNFYSKYFIETHYLIYERKKLTFENFVTKTFITKLWLWTFE